MDHRSRREQRQSFFAGTALQPPPYEGWPSRAANSDSRCPLELASTIRFQRRLQSPDRGDSGKLDALDDGYALGRGDRRHWIWCSGRRRMRLLVEADGSNDDAVARSNADDTCERLRGFGEVLGGSRLQWQMLTSILAVIVCNASWEG